MSKKRRDTDYLGDIKEAVNNIALYIKGLTYKKFLLDRKTQDAVVRNFEIIGEATKNLPKSIRDKYPSIPWRKMAGMRDKVIHEYFGVNHETVWKTAKNTLPVKRQNLSAYKARKGVNAAPVE